MSRFFLTVLLLVVVNCATLLGAPTTARPEPKPGKAASVERIRKALDSVISLEYKGEALPEVLRKLGEDHKISISLDAAVFQQMGIDPNAVTVEAKLSGVKLRSGLRTILTPYNLTFVILGDGVFVSTEEQAIYRQLKQRVSVDLSDAAAGVSLADLAKEHAVNLVMDPRTKKDGGEAKITIQLDDVPFETAVRLIADMAGLKPVRMGNVLYVTTEARAEKLKESDGLVPNPGGMPGLLAPGGGGFMPGIGGGLAVPAPGVIAPPVVPPAPPGPPEAPPTKEDPKEVPEKK